MFFKNLFVNTKAAINRMGAGTFGTCLVAFLAGLLMVIYNGPDAFNLLVTIVALAALIVGLWPPSERKNRY